MCIYNLLITTAGNRYPEVEDCVDSYDYNGPVKCNDKATSVFLARFRAIGQLVLSVTNNSLKCYPEEWETDGIISEDVNLLQGCDVPTGPLTNGPFACDALYTDVFFTDRLAEGGFVEAVKKLETCTSIDDTLLAILASGADLECPTIEEYDACIRVSWVVVLVACMLA